MRDSVNVVDTPAKAAELLERLWATQYPVGVDTETTGINPRAQTAANHGSSHISCWSLSISDDGRTGDQNFLWANMLPPFKDWLQSARPKVGHSIFTFDYHMLANEGIQLNGIVGDTLRMHRLMKPDKEVLHGLKPLAKHWLGYEQPSFASLFKRPKGVVEFVQRTAKKEPVPENWSRRKVGDQYGVPTLFVTGLIGKFGKTQEFIPLETIPTDYPQRLQALYDYASLDAKITLELYFRFLEAMSK